MLLRTINAATCCAIGFMGAVPALHAAEPHATELSADDRTRIEQTIDANAAAATKIALQIWRWAEVGFQEKQSSQALQERLRASGFTVRAGVAFSRANANRNGAKRMEQATWQRL